MSRNSRSQGLRSAAGSHRWKRPSSRIRAEPVDAFREHLFTELVGHYRPVTNEESRLAGSTLSWDRVRGVGSRLTTPLHPDDYLMLVNPLWTTRELRGRVEKVLRETDDAATLVIRPGWGWRYDHKPGQYVGIGIQVDGKFQWRSYSVSSRPSAAAARSPSRSGRCPRGCSPRTSSTVWRRAPSCGSRCPRATSSCRTRRRRRCSSSSAGSGVTPVMSMIRTLDRRGIDARRRHALLLAERRADDLPRRAREARREARRTSPCTSSTPTPTGCWS